MEVQRFAFGASRERRQLRCSEPGANDDEADAAANEMSRVGRDTE
jgi:hypothetical protein